MDSKIHNNTSSLGIHVHIIYIQNLFLKTIKSFNYLYTHSYSQAYKINTQTILHTHPYETKIHIFINTYTHKNMSVKH